MYRLTSAVKSLKGCLLGCLCCYSCSQPAGHPSGFWNAHVTEKEFFRQSLPDSGGMSGQHRVIIHRNPLVHIDKKGNFDVMLYYQWPVVGTARFSGSTVTLTPLTVNGLKKPEWMKEVSNESAGRKWVDSLFSPLTGTLDTGQATLSIDFQPWRQVSDLNDDPGVSLLHAFAPKSPVDNKTVSDKEAELVGTWRSYSGTPEVPRATEAEKQKRILEDLKAGMSLLCLRSDNTYVFDDSSQTRGRWTLEGGKVTLFPDASTAMFKGDKKVLDVSSDLQVLTTKGFSKDVLPLHRVTD